MSGRDRDLEDHEMQPIGGRGGGGGGGGFNRWNHRRSTPIPYTWIVVGVLLGVILTLLFSGTGSSHTDNAAPATAPAPASCPPPEAAAADKPKPKPHPTDSHTGTDTGSGKSKPKPGDKPTTTVPTPTTGDAAVTTPPTPTPPPAIKPPVEPTPPPAVTPPAPPQPVAPPVVTPPHKCPAPTPATTTADGLNKESGAGSTWSQSRVHFPEWSSRDAELTETRVWCTGNSFFTRSCAFEGICWDLQDKVWTVFDPYAVYDLPSASGDAPDLLLMSLIEERAYWRPRVLRQRLPTAHPIPDIPNVSTVPSPAPPTPGLVPTPPPAPAPAPATPGAPAAAAPPPPPPPPPAAPRKLASENVVWVDEPTSIVWRHQPGNFAHAMMDDFFAIYWLERTWFYRDLKETANVAAGEPRTIAGGLPWPPQSNILFIDDHNHNSEELFTVPTWRFFASHIVHLHRNMIDLIRPEFRTYRQPGQPYAANNQTIIRSRHVASMQRSMGRERDGTKYRGPELGPYDPIKEDGIRYTCFRQFAGGVPGMSMQRNEGYDHFSRYFRPAVDSENYDNAISQYISFFGATYGLPDRANPTHVYPKTASEWAIPASFDAGNSDRPPILFKRTIPVDKSKATIVVTNRPGSRVMTNADAVAAALRTAFGLKVDIVVFEHVGTQAQQAAVMANPDVVLMVGVHGAHFWNAMFMTPGSWIIEFGISGMGGQTWKFFRWPARSLGLNHDSVMTHGGGRESNVEVPIGECVERVKRALVWMGLH